MVEEQETPSVGCLLVSWSFYYSIKPLYDLDSTDTLSVPLNSLLITEVPRLRVLLLDPTLEDNLGGGYLPRVPFCTSSRFSTVSFSPVYLTGSYHTPYSSLLLDHKFSFRPRLFDLILPPIVRGKGDCLSPHSIPS